MLQSACHLRNIGRLYLLQRPRHQRKLKPCELPFAPLGLLEILFIILSNTPLLNRLIIILLSHIHILNIEISKFVYSYWVTNAFILDILKVVIAEWKVIILIHYLNETLLIGPQVYETHLLIQIKRALQNVLVG